MDIRRVGYASLAVLEAAAVIALLNEFPEPTHAVAFFLLAHGAVSLSFAFAAIDHARRRQAHSNGFVCGVFVFCAVFSIPLAGACIALAILRRAVAAETTPGPRASVTLTGFPELPDAANKLASPALLQNDLTGAIALARRKDRRLAALMAARDLPEREAIAMARLALTDPEDEVRLLAYALLSVHEEKVQSRIQTLTDQLAAAPAECHLLFHRALAHTYWETVYLGLSSGAIESFMLNSALEHVAAAQNQAFLDGGLRLLLGRILMRLGKLDQSALAFNQAKALGIDARKVQLFLNELAFMQTRSGPRRLPLAEVVTDSMATSGDASADDYALAS